MEGRSDTKSSGNVRVGLKNVWYVFQGADSCLSQSCFGGTGGKVEQFKGQGPPRSPQASPCSWPAFEFQGRANTFSPRAKPDGPFSSQILGWDHKAGVSKSRVTLDLLVMPSESRMGRAWSPPRSSAKAGPPWIAGPLDDPQVQFPESLLKPTNICRRQNNKGRERVISRLYFKTIPTDTWQSRNVS